MLWYHVVIISCIVLYYYCGEGSDNVMYLCLSGEDILNGCNIYFYTKNFPPLSETSFFLWDWTIIDTGQNINQGQGNYCYRWLWRHKTAIPTNVLIYRAQYLSSVVYWHCECGGQGDSSLTTGECQESAWW